MNAYRHAWFLVFLFVLGCAGVNPFVVEDRQDVITQAREEVKSLAEATAIAEQQGSISAEDAQRVKEDLTVAGQSLIAARVALGQGDISTYEGSLAAARAILLTLQRFFPPGG